VALNRCSSYDSIFPQNSNDNGNATTKIIHGPHEALFEAYSRVLDGPAQVLNKMKGLWRYFALPFKDCNQTWRIPRRRILRFEKFFDIKKGSASGGSGNAMIATKGWSSRVLIRAVMEKQ
jgi:hypothetical protein